MIEQNTEKAVFVGVVLEKGGERKTMEYLDELQFLAETAGAVGDKKFIQRLDQTYKATYIGTGKLEEIKAYCEAHEIKYVIQQIILRKGVGNGVEKDSEQRRNS